MARKRFEIVESARGRVLLDSIHYAHHSPSISDASPGEIKIAQLQRTLLDRRLDTVQTERTLARLDAAYDELGTTQFAQERKEVRTLRHSPVALSVFSKQLRPDEVFVEYVLDRNASYALEISRAGMTVHKLPPADQIMRLTKIYLAGVKLSKNERVGHNHSMPFCSVRY